MKNISVIENSFKHLYENWHGQHIPGMTGSEKITPLVLPAIWYILLFIFIIEHLERSRL